MSNQQYTGLKMKSTRIEQGKLMLEKLEKNIKSHFKYDINHPYIKEYQESLKEAPKEEETAKSKKGKKVK